MERHRYSNNMCCSLEADPLSRQDHFDKINLNECCETQQYDFAGLRQQRLVQPVFAN